MKLSEFSAEEIASGYAAREIKIAELEDALNEASTLADIKRMKAELKTPYSK